MKAEFELIQTSKGYYSNVQYVAFPDFGPSDVDRILSVPDVPALLIWIVRIGQGENEYTFGDKIPEAQVEVLGVVRSMNVQWDLLKLHEDLRRVMLGNPERKYPGQASPPYVGVNTREAPMGAEFLVEKQEDSAIGVFASTWYVSYITRTTEKT